MRVRFLVAAERGARVESLVGPDGVVDATVMCGGLAQVNHIGDPCAVQVLVLQGLEETLEVFPSERAFVAAAGQPGRAPVLPSGLRRIPNLAIQ